MTTNSHNYAQEYREKNLERLRANKRAYYAKDRERWKEYQRNWYAANRLRAQASRRRYYLANREKANLRAKETFMVRKYGISAVEASQLLAAQNNLCAVCRKVLIQPHIDHDHKTGEVRGLLCQRCNSAIGLLGDDLDGVERAFLYLLKRTTRDEAKMITSRMIATQALLKAVPR